MAAKTRILAIAPYHEMREPLERIAALYEEIELTVFVGDLGEGAAIAKSNFHANYDVILSRGGTAKLIQQMVPLPVVEIELSLYDILCAFKLALSSRPISEDLHRQVAVVGFGNITQNAHLLCEVLDFQLEIFTIEAEEMVRPILQRLKQRGCELVLCDMVANTTAKQMGLNTYLINSGSESIRAAFDSVRRLMKVHQTLREENHFLRELLFCQSTNTVVFDDQERLFFSTLPADEDGNPTIDLLRTEMLQITGWARRKILRNRHGLLYTIFAQRFQTREHIYTAFFFTARKAPLQANRCGLSFPTYQEVGEVFYNSLFSTSDTLVTLKTALSSSALENTPIMIIGEDGTGKRQALNGLYLHSTNSERPLASINCALLNEKTWDFLLNNPNSPLSDTGNTLHFHHVDALSEQLAQELIASLQVMEVCRRNRVFFSSIRTARETTSPIGQEFIREIGCLSVPLPSLREQSKTIPSLISLYLNRLNPSLDRQIAGISPEGAALLQMYDWPHNYTQFKRLLRELAVMAKGAVISTAEVRSALSKEKNVTSTFMRAPDSDQPLDLALPLSEINREIVRRVLADVSNNQSAAAKRLGISRTTLWRMIQTPHA